MTDLYYSQKIKMFIYGIVCPAFNRGQKQYVYLTDQQNATKPKDANVKLNFLLQYV